MFEFLFKYPSSVFSKGEFVLLGAWPKWVLAFLVLASALALGWLMLSRLPEAARSAKNWRMGIVWLLQSLMAALLLVLLWHPAIMIAELKPEQNIIAVLVDDSQSMGIADTGQTRQAEAVKALRGGVLPALQKKFQTRIYALDGRVSRLANLDDLKPAASATHIGDGLKQLVAETADLPIGAILLLSDGADNSGGIDRDTIAALRNRRIPVHTVGFGLEEPSHDVEIGDVDVTPRVLADARVVAKVNLRQHGYDGSKSRLTVRDGEKVLATHEIVFGSHDVQTETILFSAGTAGLKTFQFSVDPLPGEENLRNNSVTRLVNVESGKRRILYIDGEPRWEYKFIRRAEEDDHFVELVSMLRTTENKIYRQGVDNPAELVQGFPATVEELFGYQAIIIGSVEATYFTQTQQELIKQFVERRGGGLMMLGGRFAMADGGWDASPVSDLLPVTLPRNKATFQRDPAKAELTPAGADSIICRLVEDPKQNSDRWKMLPSVMNYQDVGEPKPGAAVLLNMNAAGKKMPLLITQNYGRGRTAVLATEGTWRWRMGMPAEDRTHQEFWQQLLRWLVSDSPGRVSASVANPILLDEGSVQVSAEVRDTNYLPAADAQVQARIIGPEGVASMVDMAPDPRTPGIFQAEWNAAKPGPYIAEVTAKRGPADPEHDTSTFQRTDGVAENFHTGQNRELLQMLSSGTGGRYWKPSELSRIKDEIPYSEAGVAIREPKDLWNMPVVFLLILGLRSFEWLLRRKWGIV